MTYTALALIAIAVIGLSSAAAGPVVVEIMAMLGLTFLSVSATAGGFCTPIPAKRDNVTPNNIQHNICANTRPGNLWPNLDACVLAPDGTQKNFDAFNGSILWEVKTYNSLNGNISFLIGASGDKKEWLKESSIARQCGFPFWYTVGDPVHTAEILKIDPGFVPAIADNLEIDSVNCLNPRK